MAWQVIIDQISSQGDKLVLYCIITDGVLQKFGQYFTFSQGTSLNDIKTNIKQFVDGLDFVDARAKELQLGIFDLTLSVIGNPPDKREIWFQEFSKLNLLRNLASLTIISEGDAIFVDQLKLVQSTFDPSYII